MTPGRSTFFLLLLVCLAWCAAAGAADTQVIPPPADLAGLETRFAAHVNQDRFRHAHWGVQVVSLDTGRAVFEHNADDLLIPASNTKLFTGALALDRLGPDFRIRTSVYSQKRPTRRGTLQGDLILYGRGDPTFAARFHGGNLEQALGPLLEAVAAAGIRRVRGDVVADASCFASPALGSGWAWDDLQYGYGAEVSALTINDNTVDVLIRPADTPGHPASIRLAPASGFLAVSNRCVTTSRDVERDIRVERPLSHNLIIVSGRIPVGDTGITETVSVHAPAAWFGHLFKQALQQRGTRVSGNVRMTDPVGSLPNSAASPVRVELGAVESPPLRDLVARMMKPSQNLYAQLLLLQVGSAELADAGPHNVAQDSWPPAGVFPRTEEAAGIRALEALLRRAGIPADQVLFEEGSGLSRRHLVTPAAIVQLLRFMDQHPHAAAFRDALPVAGADGTLRSRMRETPAAGNARAKTGTLRYVNSLSGYVASMAGERFAFALLLNNYRNLDPNRSARADLDEFVTTLAGLEWRTDRE